MNDPIDIMLDCCLPDPKKLAEAVGSLSPGEIVRVRIDNSDAIMYIVESFLRNKWCSVVDISDQNHSKIISIKKSH